MPNVLPEENISRSEFQAAFRIIEEQRRLEREANRTFALRLLAITGTIAVSLAIVASGSASILIDLIGIMTSFAAGVSLTVIVRAKKD